MKPKYKKGQWVEFLYGFPQQRKYKGCISGWYSNTTDKVIYDICRNKKSYRMIYEDDIIGLS